MPAQRRIIVFDRISADGYFSDSQGGLGWAVPEPALDRAAADNLHGTGTLLFGRRTYEVFRGFWPSALRAGSDAEDPHAPGRRTPEIARMAEWIDAARKIVFSRTLAEPGWRNATVLREIEPDAIHALKQEAASDMMLFGSGSVVSRLAALGLVDEYQLIVSPVLLGAGAQLVRDLRSPVPLELLESTAYPSGNVKLRFAPKG